MYPISNTLLCIRSPRILWQSRNTLRGNFAFSYQLDWKQIVPALFGPPGEDSTVVWEGKYTRKRLCSGPWMMGSSGFGWVFVLVRWVYSVKPLSPVYNVSLWRYGGMVKEGSGTLCSKVDGLQKLVL